MLSRRIHTAPIQVSNSHSDSRILFTRRDSSSDLRPLSNPPVGGGFQCSSLVCELCCAYIVRKADERVAMDLNELFRNLPASQQAALLQQCLQPTSQQSAIGSQHPSGPLLNSQQQFHPTIRLGGTPQVFRPADHASYPYEHPMAASVPLSPPVAAPSAWQPTPPSARQPAGPVSQVRGQAVAQQNLVNRPSGDSQPQAPASESAAVAAPRAKKPRMTSSNSGKGSSGKPSSSKAKPSTDDTDKDEGWTDELCLWVGFDRRSVQSVPALVCTSALVVCCALLLYSVLAERFCFVVLDDSAAEVASLERSRQRPVQEQVR